MKRVYIKYNPYILKTEILINDDHLEENSLLREKTGRNTYLQEWIEELPQLLVDETNDNEFYITFYGTESDYEDVIETFRTAKDSGLIYAVSLEKAEVKNKTEFSEKVAKIDEVFEEVQKVAKERNMTDLMSEELINTYNQAKSSNFDISIVATMSAGKSTLINALLGKKLMPSAQEACTAIITRIKDTDNPKGIWKAEVYDKSERLIQSVDNINLETMTRLNNNENVLEINIEGNIPFVNTSENSLVLIDTPGPNNSRNEEHGAVQNKFVSSSSKTLVLYVLEPTFGRTDDDALLRKIAKSMEVGGKKSRDRFIFVVNKMDGRQKEDGPIETTLDRVREYLESVGIKEPNLYPVAALPALTIRQAVNGEDIDEDTEDYNYVAIRKFNRNENLHLEEHSPLLKSEERKFREQIECGTKEEEAIIHTGVPALEVAIRRYVDKYANVAKIRTMVEAFMRNIEDSAVFEEQKRLLINLDNDNGQLRQQISLMKEAIENLKETKEYKEAVDNAVKKVNKVTEKEIKSKTKTINSRIEQRTRSVANRGQIDIYEADELINSMKRFVNRLSKEYHEDLNDILRQNLIDTANNLMESYIEKINSLTTDFNSSLSSDIKIEPLKFMSAKLENINVNNFVEIEEVVVGHHTVSDAHWWNPFSWWSSHEEDDIEEREYVNLNKLTSSLGLVENNFKNIEKRAVNHALQQSKVIAEKYNEEFANIDRAINDKLDELQKYINKIDVNDEEIRKLEKNIAWFNHIKREVEHITEI
ncbi:dynamin family protein [Ligilactobacillus equi]|uniref:Dynamin N-terminal domain-containing protein n=1 Tax=Ligilactobacillus equi DSM 15833 = JCM 10991 TaxID=1423740 RepID=A0A0R1TXA7_9LACO|nr:dynamin family protein [Ligilactobacillus equi]KRL83173.1 hypothetical protein FC36_GL000740 [Ligilactobacillus equi DSM 15833 = JCM 10991]